MDYHECHSKKSLHQIVIEKLRHDVLFDTGFYFPDNDIRGEP